MVGRLIRSYRENESIMTEGEPGTCAYLIESGMVLVYLISDGIEIPLKTLGKGEIFGEMAMIDNRPRSASCRALSNVSLVVVTQEQLLDRIHASDPIVRLLMRALLDRLRGQNDTLRGIPVQYIPIVTEELQKERIQALARIGIENQLAEALKNNEFIPYYQPIYNIETDQACGCEALIRWRTPNGKIITPGEFVDVLEESSLILNVGQMMIEKCLEDLARMKNDLPVTGNFFVSINISGRQFTDPNFLGQLEAARAKSGMPARHVKLEVTERIMTEGPQAIKSLQACRDLGYHIAIDDFGTGFSSLQYLASMPLTDLKIDRTFISQMMIDEKAQSIVKTLIYLAKPLNLNLIAEGIETQAQKFRLKALGVKYGQGFLLSRPVPYEELVLILNPKKTPLEAA